MTSSERRGRAASCTRTISGVVGNLREARAHGVGPRRAARDGRVDLAGAEFLREQDRRLLPLLRDDDDDRVDPLRGLEPLEALGEKNAPARGGRTPSAGRRRAARHGPRRPGRPTCSLGGDEELPVALFEELRG